MVRENGWCRNGRFTSGDYLIDGWAGKGLRYPPRPIAQLFRRIGFKSPKATISFVMLVRPSVFTHQLGFHWTNFREILYWGGWGTFHENLFEKLQIWLKSDKNNGNCTRRPNLTFRGRALWYILITKPKRCTNFWSFIPKMNLRN